MKQLRYSEIQFISGGQETNHLAEFGCALLSYSGGLIGGVSAAGILSHPYFATTPALVGYAFIASASIVGFLAGSVLYQTNYALRKANGFLPEYLKTAV